jgi:hypothetical protein
MANLRVLKPKEHSDRKVGERKNRGDVLERPCSQQWFSERLYLITFECSYSLLQPDFSGFLLQCGKNRVLVQLF